MFYDNLKAACASKGVSVTSMLKEFKISTSNGTAWKNGTSPSADIVVRFSEFLGVTTDFLLKGITPNENIIISDLEMECLNRFSRLNDIDKGRILDRMETLYDSYSPEEKEDVS